MRHLGSLLAGVVLAPVVWVLVALGQAKSSNTLAAWQEQDAYDTKNLIAPAALLAVAGLLLGLVATLRFSPLGPVVAGAVYVLAYAWLFVSPFKLLDAVPDKIDIFGQKIRPEVPLTNGTLLLLGALLLVSVFSAKRWRRWPTPAPALTPTSGTGTSGTGTGSAGLTDWPPPAAGDPLPSRTGQFEAVKDGTSESRHATDDEPTYRLGGGDAGATRPGSGSDTPWSSPPRS